jgi:hypothetical protein
LLLAYYDPNGRLQPAPDPLELGGIDTGTSAASID